MKKDYWCLIFNHARIDVVLKKEKSKVIAFSINLSTLEEDKRYDVVRWDTAHGFVHKHEFGKRKKQSKKKKV